MLTLAQSTTAVLATGTVAADIVIVGLGLAVAIPSLRQIPMVRRVVMFVGSRAVEVGLAMALAGTIGSLWYSNVIGYEPCDLCWVQRIFLYPQVLLLGVALVKRDRGAVDYALALSLAGLAVAAYHVSLQVGLTPLLPCSVGAVSCGKLFFLAYGYVTIPVMSLTAFALQTLVMLAAKVVNRNNTTQA